MDIKNQKPKAALIFCSDGPSAIEKDLLSVETFIKALNSALIN